MQALTPTPYAVFANTASNVSGTVSAVQLSGAVANGNLPANPIFSGTVTANSFSGSGASLTALNANNLASGTVPLAQLSSITSNQLDAATWQLATNLNGGNAALASNVVSGISITNAFITNSIFAGNGGGLTNLNAAQLNGPVASANLSGTYGNALTLNNAGNNFSGSFSGSGANLTALNANNLTSGTVPLAQLPVAVVTNYESGVTLSNLTLNGALSLPAISASSSNVIYSGTRLLLYADNNDNFFSGSAGNLTMSGGDNSAIGVNALFFNTSGSGNTAIGVNALEDNTSGSGNTANGVSALYHNNGSGNTANGDGALFNNSSGTANTAIGYEALYLNTNGFENTAIGYGALFLNTNGSYNTANGLEALYNNTSGSNNIALGYLAGYNLSTGSSNIDIGNEGFAADNNIIRIGTPGIQTNTFIAGVINGNGGGLTNLNASQLSGGVIADSVLPGFQGNDNVIGGGVGNYFGNSADLSAILGGQNNTNDAYQSSIGGGIDNLIQDQAYTSFLGGGNGNSISNNADDSFLGGGQGNSIATQARFSFLGGGVDNTIQRQGLDDALVGGNGNSIGSGTGNTPSDVFLGGGNGNSIASNDGVIGGGSANSIGAQAQDAVLAGGQNNMILSASAEDPYQGGEDGTIGGGSFNQVGAFGATVPGGANNIANGRYSFAAGNQAQATNDSSFVWADNEGAPFGSVNDSSFNVRAQGGARFVTSGGGMTVDGEPVFTGRNGAGLTNLSVASLPASVAMLNSNQTFTATNFFSKPVGIESAAPLGVLEIQGGAQSSGQNDPHAIALGYSTGGYRHWIRTRHNTSPVDNAIDFYVNSSSSAGGSVGPTNGSVLALSLNAGNVGIGTTEPTDLLVVGGSATPAYCNGTTWVNGSDRNSKEDFTAINPREVLAKISALPITEWKYKVEADGTEHLGPMAQDFHAAFGLNGPDDKHIATVDEEGVALAAIQGLNQKLADQLNQQVSENTKLEQRIEKLEQMMNQQNEGAR